MKIPDLSSIILVATLVLVLGGAADAQQQPKKVRRIGYLYTGFQAPKEFLDAMRHLGYVDGHNIVLEYRAAEGREELLPQLASELVRLNVDVIVAPGAAAGLAAKQATKTVPVIYMGGGDPVALGLVASLARPGGNITGITELSPELTSKRLELLKEAFPKISKVAVLVRDSAPGVAGQLEDLETAARALRLKLQMVRVKGADGFENSFLTITNERAGALIEVPNPLFHANVNRIVQFTSKNGLPTIFHSKDFVEAGGLMTYGADFIELYRRAAHFVDKILKGAKPADLPVEQPMKFELVVNLKTAKQIGVNIDPNLLARANRIIR